jgi:hypothetical protein
MSRMATRVGEFTTTSGLGIYDLDGAITDFRGFVVGIGAGADVPYVVESSDGSTWEVNIGTLTDAATDTLSRDTLIASSTGAAIDWPDTTQKRVFSAPLGEIIGWLKLDSGGTYLARVGAKLNFDSAGNAGFGVVAPDGTVHIHSDTAGAVTANAAGQTLVVESGVSGNGGISILNTDANSTNIFFGSPSDNDYARIQCAYGAATTSRYAIRLDGSEAWRLENTATGVQMLPESSSSSAVPTYSFVEDRDTGVHRPSANKVQVICGGVVAAQFVGELAGGSSWVGSGDIGPDATFGAISEENRVVLVGEASHASFGSTVFQIPVHRASTSAYLFAQFKSGTGGTPDNEFTFYGDGNASCDGAWSGGGADYAEMFEWADGNPANEDRVGHSVTLVGDKIKIAEPGDDVLGVVSDTYSALGDAGVLKWTGRYERDDFGRYVMEDYEAVEWVDVTPAEFEELEVDTGVPDGKGKPIFRKEQGREKAGERRKFRSYADDKVPADLTVPANAKRTTQQRRKQNPAFDPNTAYTPRTERPEWSAVGLMGKCHLRVGQEIDPRWRKLRDIAPGVELWLVR